MREAKNDCKTPRGPHGATHQVWAYRSEAVIWIEGKPFRPNIIPFASEMMLWLQQKVSSLPLHTKFGQSVVGEPSNPYTYSLSAISLAISEIINDAFEFAESTEPMDSVVAEVRRIRLESELIIYAARFCEATIKQMLYCTQIPKDMYERATMGQLLARECEGCKKAGKQRHDISLLGSLAHRFFLCYMLDTCAIDHLQIVARRRNLEAAHSESQFIHPRTAEESRKHLASSIAEIGYELGHMADHIGTIEKKMIEETELFIRSYPNVSPLSELERIPVRNFEQYHDDVACI
jgi:hypothetical protein